MFLTVHCSTALIVNKQKVRTRAWHQKRDRMSVYVREGVTVLDFGAMEIWDGADLALLRETLTRLVDVEKCKSIGVELTSVKYIPSGFFWNVV